MGFLKQTKLTRMSNVKGKPPSFANKKLNIIWGERPYRKREVMVPWNKGENVPGWSPKVSLEEGIKKIDPDEDVWNEV